MRLTQLQTQQIAQTVKAVAGNQARAYLFGSRLDDDALGGDIDILLALNEPVDNPALLSARLAAKISRLMHGRKVDVLLSAPNLQHLPIHDIAFKAGKLL